MSVTPGLLRAREQENGGKKNLEFPPRQPPRVRRPPACFRTRTKGLLEVSPSTPVATLDLELCWVQPRAIEAGAVGGQHTVAALVYFEFWCSFPAGLLLFTFRRPPAAAARVLPSCQSRFSGGDGTVQLPQARNAPCASDMVPACHVYTGEGRSRELAFADSSFSLTFQETPTKELGHCGGDAHGPELNSPAPSSGSPYLSRCINSESSTDEEGTSLH